MPEQQKDTIKFFHVKEHTDITPISSQHFSSLHKLTIAISALMVSIALFISLLLITTSNTNIIADDSIAKSNNTALVNTTGHVQGVFDIASTTPTINYTTYSFYTSTTISAPIQSSVVINNLPTKFNSKSPITLNGTLPSKCINTDGFFCTAQISKVGSCHNGVCGATALSFTVTPDANGNWSYTVPAGLDAGDYQVTIKDQNGNVLETTNFTVTNQAVATTTVSNPKNLPNTGVTENIIFSVVTSLFIIITSIIIFNKNSKKRILN